MIHILKHFLDLVVPCSGPDRDTHTSETRFPTLKTNQVMSELSIVLDLRLLGKMWHGTRDEQTPQPVRMTLGNEGTIRPPLLSVVVSLWLPLLCFGVSTGCHQKSNQHGINAVFIHHFVPTSHCCAAELHGL